MIVDSCSGKRGGKPIALEYLESLKVDISSQIKLVLITHWHDDHIFGVSDVLRVASSAMFACSMAINNREFFSLIAANKKIKLVGHSSGIQEFSEVLSILGSRYSGKKATGPDHWVGEGMVLYTGKGPSQVKVYALSPSAQTITDSIGNFSKLMPSIGKTIQKFPSLTPNDHSIVLFIETKEVHLLLGGDLEKGTTTQRGWKAIIGSTLRPKIKSSGYKVPHHGSENADLDEIWTELNLINPHTLLTPYARGRKPLPSEEDVKRLKDRSSLVYCTVWPPTLKPPRRLVDKTMNEVARNRRAIPKSSGHIRLRYPLNGNKNQIMVDLFDEAKKL